MADNLREEDESLREGVRQNLAGWLQKLECGGDVQKKTNYKMKFVKKLTQSPVAIETGLVNEQHYQVPTEFFETVFRLCPLAYYRSLLTWNSLEVCKIWKYNKGFVYKRVREVLKCLWSVQISLFAPIFSMYNILFVTFPAEGVCLGQFASLERRLRHSRLNWTNSTLLL